ncbi:MAG TPA: UDP-N-acetylmuramate--L-alanine ligase [Candidatus Baltobacteraceae bacterium]|nr:UDP-N-acetylmuramate--L-alanine ligase [Candidatus Baltobacteraceae bacterium]
MTDTAYHLVGIGGIGMSAIARLLLARGARVGGSDVRRTRLVAELEAEGARVAIGHRAENVGDADVVVVSSAIDKGNAEFQEALARKLRVVTRGEMLAELARGHKLAAVAGTHGKTTTTAMLASIFEAANLDPTVAVGGVRVDSGTNARAGAGRWFVTESDESDGSFLHLAPAIAIVTNVENDHVASDADLPRLLAQFAEFVNKVPPSGRAVIGSDNPSSAFVARQANAPVTTFATRAAADLGAIDIIYEDLGSRFTVCEVGVALGEVRLGVPGEINVLNALGAFGAARAIGIPFDVTASALARFRGVRRRFEIVGRGALTVVDDYAHHPTAIAQTIAAARGFARGKPIVVAFQPHRYTRTSYLKDDFARALGGADRVVLAPVYAASEPAIPGISHRSIGEPLAAGGTPVSYVEDVEALVDAIPREAPDGALVLMLGAGSISAVAHRLGERLAAPLAR